MTAMKPVTVAQLRASMGVPTTVAAYRQRVLNVAAPGACQLWTGAMSGRGHGQFWIAHDRMVIAHRFGFALAFGVDALLAAHVLAHACGNLLCQNMAHLGPAPSASTPPGAGLRVHHQDTRHVSA